MSNIGGKTMTILAVAGIGWYTGVKFWQPLIIEQLRKDGNLRDDVYTGYVDDSPNSWKEVRDRVKSTLHPEQATLVKDENLAETSAKSQKEPNLTSPKSNE